MFFVVINGDVICLFFLWFKNKSKFRWCLVVSIVFNKRFFIIILCIVIVIYLYILDFFKKYRKFK